MNPARPVQERPATELLDQQLALSAYFESLLDLPAGVVADAAADTGNGLPRWAREPFQSLLFVVDGITLAAPLVLMNGIMDWDGAGSRIPGRRSWCLGLLPHRGVNVQLVDTAALVVPAGHRGPAPDPAATRQLVLVGDGRYGLVCDRVEGTLTLDPEAVRWRGDRSRRRWLAGTCVSHMCGLLDLDELVGQLDRGEWDGPAGGRV